MPRFTAPMERRLGELEQEYGVAPQQREEEESGFFGRRGFLGNISDYYGGSSWGDWWRGIFGQEKKEKPRYTVYPEWGEGNIRTLREIMMERED